VDVSTTLHGATILGNGIFVPFHRAPLEKDIFFMPCAPQTLSDWDQAFAVFVGVVMGVYELGPKALALVLLKVKGFLNACRLRIWSSRDPAP
jgi:hypothetical protein